jgi:hypothetical protein
MMCKKHKSFNIPCIMCMKQEYDTYKNTPGHDFTEIKKILKKEGLIT